MRFQPIDAKARNTGHTGNLLKIIIIFAVTPNTNEIIKLVRSQGHRKRTCSITYTTNTGYIRFSGAICTFGSCHFRSVGWNMLLCNFFDIVPANLMRRTNWKRHKKNAYNRPIKTTWNAPVTLLLTARVYLLVLLTECQCRLSLFIAHHRRLFTIRIEMSNAPNKFKFHIFVQFDTIRPPERAAIERRLVTAPNVVVSKRWQWQKAKKSAATVTITANTQTALKWLFYNC